MYWIDVNDESTYILRNQYLDICKYLVQPL